MRRIYFSVFVKSGEIYTTDQPKELYVNPEGFTTCEERPRFLCNPCNEMKGHLVLLQSLIMKAAKALIPGFVHAQNTEALEATFTSALQDGYEHFHSTDGSAFDSTQYRLLMDHINTPIHEVFFPMIEQTFLEGHFYQNFDLPTRMDLVEKVRRAYTEHTQQIVIRVPGVSIPNEMHSQLQHQIMKTEGIDSGDGVVLRVNGTTASGHALTTFDNTFRQLVYRWFDIWRSQGYRGEYPWEARLDVESGSYLPNHSLYRVYASGDDCVVACRSLQAARTLDAAVRANAARGKFELDQGMPQGLGQIIKSASIGDIHSVEFLSKKFYHKHGRAYVTRDYTKQLCRQFEYKGKNSLLLQNPVLHQEVMLHALYLESSSRHLEDVAGTAVSEQRRAELRQKTALPAFSQLDPVKYALVRVSEAYPVEAEINDAVGIDLGSVIEARLYRRTIVAGSLKGALTREI